MSLNLIYPPAPPGGSNPSVGTDGSTAPNFSTQVGFTDGSGNLQAVSPSNPLPVDIHIDTVIVNENLAEVNGHAVDVGTGASGLGTQRVAISTDSGIATSANQATEI